MDVGTKFDLALVVLNVSVCCWRLFCVTVLLLILITVFNC